MTVMVVADGASIHTRRLLRALVDRDVRVELAAFEDAQTSGVVVHRLASLRPGADVRYLIGAPRLARLIRDRRPAIVHAHYLTSYGAMAALAMRLVGRTRPRLVQSAWGTDLLVTARSSPIWSALIGWALRSADLVTGDSRGLEREARRLAPNVRWHRFVFGPPAALLAANEERVPLVVSMRNLEADMRVDLVVRAFRHAARVAPAALAGWRLLVAGAGREAERVASAAAGDAAIELAGRLDQTDLYARLARARVQVAVPQSDSTSAALLDGLAVGLVPVVNDVDGPREWVDETIGEIVPANPTVDDLAAAIVRATLRAPSVDRIRERVREVTWEGEVDRLVDAYRSLLPR